MKGMPAIQPLEPVFDVKRRFGPYPGLRPFEMHEWPIFFGRERITDEVIDQLYWQQMVVVHGKSGCGKTSFVHAGLLARLEQEHTRSGMHWRLVAALPGEAPLDSLATGIARLDGAAADSDRVRQIRGVLSAGREAASHIATLVRRREEEHICIYVDQLEDLLTFAENHDRHEAQLFVDIFVGLHEKLQPGMYAVLTVRSEFLDHCDRLGGLAQLVNQTQQPLQPIEGSALMHAIREPARLYNGEIRRELAERLVADANNHLDHLPLLQHALMLLLRRKVGSVNFNEEIEPWDLGLEDYNGGGGLAALLSAHADEITAKAAPDPHRRAIVRKLFRALMDIDHRGAVVRRPRAFAELVELTESDQRTLKGVVNHFRTEGASF